MIFYYLDASAWVKRYYLETGTSWCRPFLTLLLQWLVHPWAWWR